MQESTNPVFAIAKYLLGKDVTPEDRQEVEDYIASISEKTEVNVLTVSMIQTYFPEEYSKGFKRQNRIKHYYEELKKGQLYIDEHIKGGADKIGQFYDKVTETYFEFYQGRYYSDSPLITFILHISPHPPFIQLHEVRDTTFIS